MTPPRAALRAPQAWWLLGLVAFVALPWYLPQNLSLWQALSGAFDGSDSAAGVFQAWRYGKPWLWPVVLALIGSGAALRWRTGRAQGRALVLAAGFGLVSVLIAGFAIGARGWSFAALESTFGPAPGNQFGIGLGGAATLLALLMLLGSGIARLGA